MRSPVLAKAPHSPITIRSLSMQLATMSALTFTALALGFLTGRAWERCTRAWSDLKVAKGQVALLRVAIRVLSTKAVAWVLVSAGVAAWALYTLAAERG